MTDIPAPGRPRLDPSQASGHNGLRAQRGYLGLALMGWGLSILVGVTPHEDPIVGGALTIFGTALVFTAPRLPTMGQARPALLVAAGLSVALGVVAYNAWRHAAWDAPKAAIVVVGLALAAAAPFLDRRLPQRAPPRARTNVAAGGAAAAKARSNPTDARPNAATVATLVACGLVIASGPLAAWALQALFKSAIGTTPTEAFVQYALVAPMGWLLALVGLHPAVDGQSVTYATRQGPLTLEVGAACSGVQAMAMFGVVLTVFLLVERPPGRRLALWCAIGLAGVYAVNLLRLATLLGVGYQWGAQALLRTHADAGWIFFVAWAILFAWLVRAKAPAKTRDEATPRS